MGNDHSPFARYLIKSRYRLSSHLVATSTLSELRYALTTPIRPGKESPRPLITSSMVILTISQPPTSSSGEEHRVDVREWDRVLVLVRFALVLVKVEAVGEGAGAEDRRDSGRDEGVVEGGETGREWRS